MGKSNAPKTTIAESKVDKKSGKNVEEKKPKKLPVVPQYVSLARCVTRLKKELNATKEAELTVFKEDNKNYFSELSELIKSKQGKDKDEKGVINEKIQGVKKSNKISEDYYNIKRNLYRVTNSATAYTATVIEYVVTELLTYGIHTTLRDTKSQRAPKVDISRFTSDDNRPEVLRLLSVPLLNSLSAFKHMDKNIKDKDKDEPFENITKDTDGPTKKASPLYDTLITKRFKSLCHELSNSDRKLCCSVTVKTLISNIILELIEHFTRMLRIVVGKLSKTKTITDIHIKGAIELSFLFDTSNADYDGFISKIDESHKNIQLIKQNAKPIPSK